MECQVYRQIVALRPRQKHVTLHGELTPWSKHEEITELSNRCSFMHQEQDG
jgi:hypothetical protein